MSYPYDSLESIDAYSAERAEVGFAEAAMSGVCADGHHGYLPNRRGGGICRWCGDEIGAEEL